ncbi:MAG TPA: hypothetical protein VKY42_10225 [Trueperaceae bacterium]|nr:hypothetical protein [Trueperaceae bacterium]
MASLTPPTLATDPQQRHGLCPACRSVRVAIRSQLEVEYEVEACPTGTDIVVVDERLAESGWDDADEAFCPACGWSGRVAELSG